jgi:hypothetical protein
MLMMFVVGRLAAKVQLHIGGDLPARRSVAPRYNAAQFLTPGRDRQVDDARS